MSDKNTNVLALNKAWMPVEIVTHKDAFRLMCKAHAKALETINGSYMVYTMDAWIDLHMHEKYTSCNTVSLEIPIPEIIILTEYDKIPKRFIKFNRQNLLIRDEYVCAYCGCELDMNTTTVDHIIPQAKGGETSWTNCVSACKGCNHEKDDNMPVGKYKPNTKPREPYHGSPIYGMRKELAFADIPDSWKKFLHIGD